MPRALTVESIVAELKTLGSATYKHTMIVHGAREPIYGVKISDLKKIQKRAGGTDYQLALDLWTTGIYDAMYLAGLMADDARMTKKDLQRWLSEAYCPGLYQYPVPWVAAGSAPGFEVGLAWIESKKESAASAGWFTLAAVVALFDDEDLDLAVLSKLLERVEARIHSAPNNVRYAMNNFIIALGSYVKPLTADAVETALAIGVVHVDMGETSCRVPAAAAYIDKVKKRGSLGKKRKTVKC